jgi:hypothetical protein
MNAITRVFEETVVAPVNRNYAVSESGRVGRIGNYGWLQPCRLKRGGYLAVNLWSKNRGRTWPLHQLVCIAFHGPRPSPKHDAAHIDGNKANNHWSNLRWATRAENEADKIRHGRSNRGERNGMAKLTNEQAANVVTEYAAGVTQAALAQRYGVTQGAISNIVRGKRRNHRMA